MNLEELVDENGLQQDEWSLHGGVDGNPPVFGEHGQLRVIGHNGGKGNKKFYILECSVCKQDGELFGEGLFRSLKASLVDGGVPCGCAAAPRWTQSQFHIRCIRKATELGYIFKGFVEEWKGKATKISMTCSKHGEWSSGAINEMINGGSGCPGCKADVIKLAKTKPDEVMIASFFASEAFHPDTKFYRSERLDSRGSVAYWHVHCPECGEKGEGASGSLQMGKRPCACSKNRQQQAYINWVIDDNNNAVAIKFGIARDSKQRIKKQNSKSVYEIRQYLVYTFPDVASCKAAERECKKELECGVISKTNMLDGWTETTWAYNLSKVKAIYEGFGGILQEESVE